MVGRRISLLFAVFSLSLAAHSQALPTATGGPISVQGGAGVSFANSDYTTQYVKGVSFFASADLAAGLGVAVEYNDNNLVTPQDLGETSFMGGLRFTVKKKSFRPYVKVLAGLGTVHLSQGYFLTNATQSSMALGLGAGLDYRLSEHFFVRAIDFEYQDWRNFPPNGLSPYVITIGAGYRWPIGGGFRREKQKK
jgi:opacity protein-like surface antigen